MLNYAKQIEIELKQEPIITTSDNDMVFTVKERLSLWSILFDLRKNQLNGGVSRYAIDVQDLELWQS